MNIVIVAQAGRIGYQALLCAASIRAFHDAAAIRVFICTPRNSPRWERDPEITDSALLSVFERYGCEITPFDNADFGSVYPHSNKIYAVRSLPPDEPFLFLDSDSVLVGKLDADDTNLASPRLKPGGSSWPVRQPEGLSLGETWRRLYDWFGFDAAPYRDPERTDDEHQCYPYYNAGVVYHAEAGTFARQWLAMSRRIWRHRPDFLLGQPVRPWLDQITLPLVLASLGVPRAADLDPIHEKIVHYHFPFYLQVRNDEAAALLRELSKDAELMSVLKHDAGFGYYLSDEAKAIVQEVHEAFWKSDHKGGYKAFQNELRRRVPLMR